MDFIRVEEALIEELLMLLFSSEVKWYVHVFLASLRAHLLSLSGFFPRCIRLIVEGIVSLLLLLFSLASVWIRRPMSVYIDYAGYLVSTVLEGLADADWSFYLAA